VAPAIRDRRVRGGRRQWFSLTPWSRGLLATVAGLPAGTFYEAQTCSIGIAVTPYLFPAFPMQRFASTPTSLGLRPGPSFALP
jgi:hypothetical protein